MRSEEEGVKSRDGQEGNIVGHDLRRKTRLRFYGEAKGYRKRGTVKKRQAEYG